MPRSKAYAELTEDQKENIRKKARLYYLKNKSKIYKVYLDNKEKILKQRKLYRQKNLEKITLREKKYRQKNSVLLSKRSKEYRGKKYEEDKNFYKKQHIKNKDKRNNYSKDYHLKNKEVIRLRKKSYHQKTDVKDRKRKYNRTYLKEHRKIPQIKIGHQFRARMNVALKSKGLRKIKKLEFLGCSLEFFKKHLEKKFQPGMNWSNYKWDGWHIDHIKPVSSFNLTNENELKKCFHYLNLQPLWAKDNFKKSNKVI